MLPSSAVSAWQRLRPFAAACLAAFLLLPTVGQVRWPEALAALVLSGVLLAAVLAAPDVIGRRADGVAVVMLAAIALLRDSAGGASGGYGVLMLIPVLWVALYGTRPQLIRVLCAVALALAVPLIVVGDPRYPAGAWRSGPLLVLCAAVVGFAVQELLVRERAATERAQQLAAERRRLLSVLGDGVVVTDLRGRVLEVNQALCEMTGYPADELVGRAAPVPLWPGERDELLAALAAGGGEFEARLERKNGAPLVVAITLAVDRDATTNAAIIATVKDITEHVRMRHELERLARTDTLTGLLNRRAFEEIRAREIATAKRTRQPLALAMLDLDHFKRYNDTKGHPAGDALLRAVSRSWSARLRETDVLARWGGEEFCLLLPNCGADDAAALIEELRRRVPDRQTVSAGIATWQDGMSGDALVAAADAELYAAKRAGRNRSAIAVA